MSNLYMDKKLIPNSTQIPNIINDFLIPQLPEAETRIILYICRRTFGFHKEEDQIAFSQFINGIKTTDGRLLDMGTGLVRGSVNTALKSLIKSGAVFVRRNTKGYFYQINLEMDIDKVVQGVNQFREQTKSSSANRLKSVQSLDTQKKGKQIETKVYASGSKEPSAHSVFIKFFSEMCRKIRGFTPKITIRDGTNLKRVLDLTIVSEQELEQIALYFLADYRYRNFAPSISTFLSAGILNGLINDLKNRVTFWKELDGYLSNFADKPITQPDNFVQKLEEIKNALVVNKTLNGHTP